MKKALSIFAFVLFVAGISAPAMASAMGAPVVIELADEDTKKKCDEQKAPEKAKSKSPASDCSKESQKECSGEKKTNDCKKECEKKK
jgi:hypothetical protein